MNGSDLRREESVLRIMEALSGIDGELLERCEKAAAGSGRPEGRGKGRLYRFTGRYGKICAACLCAALLGAAFWNMQKTENSFYNGSGAGGGDAAPEAAAPDGAAQQSSAAMEDTAELPERMPEETAGASWEEGAEYYATAEVQEEPEQTTELQPEDKAAQEVGQNIDAAPGIENLQMADAMQAGFGPEDEIAWAEAYGTAVLGSHVPPEAPEGYSRLSAKRSKQDGADQLLLTWGDGEHILWLKLTAAEPEAEELSDAGTVIISMDGEDWQQLIPGQDEDGSIRFAVRFEDGVLAEYRGSLTREEFAAMLEKLGQ